MEAQSTNELNFGLDQEKAAWIDDEVIRLSGIPILHVCYKPVKSEVVWRCDRSRMELCITETP